MHSLTSTINIKGDVGSCDSKVLEMMENYFET